MFRLFIISTLLVLVGCSQFSSIKVTDPRTGIEYSVPKHLNDVPGIKALANACAQEAGRVVTRTVEVDGYFDADISRCEPGCWDSFSKSDFQYLEFEVKAPKNYEFLQEEGFWRVSKQDKADSRCDERIMNELKKYSEVRPRNLDFCVVFEKIDELRSRYRAESDIDELQVGDYYGSDVVKGYDRVVDTSDGSIVGEEVTVDLYARYRFNYAARQLTCDSLGFGIAREGFREYVLQSR